MRYFIQYSAIVLLSTCATFAFAGGYDYTKEDTSGYNNFKVNDESDYSRDGHAVYFFGGYVYTYRFLNSARQTVTNSGTSYTYLPNKVVPNTFSGVEAGVGKEWSRHIDFQLAFMQQFRETKKVSFEGNSYSFGVKANAVLGDIGYVFNPDDQFQVMGKLGVLISQFNNLVEVNGGTAFTASDDTKLDPAGGLELLTQFTKHIGLRVSMMYVADTASGKNSNGEINTLLGLSYTL